MSENYRGLDIFELHASFCSIFSSPTRLRILWLLSDGEKTVTEIAESLGLHVPNVSQHLRVMRGQGAVVTRRAGRAVYYRIANPKFLEGANLIRQGLVEELDRRGHLERDLLEE